MNTATIGGLSHLVEAASALTKLVDVPRKSPNADVSVVATQEFGSCGQSVVSDDDEESKLRKRTPISSREIFPQRLMQVLGDASLSDVLSWLPHGRSFVIIRPDVFAERVLPHYFPSNDPRSSTKYPSFTRKLNRWGFRQATRGADTGAFHHPLFRRDEPERCLEMVCQKSRKRASSTSMSTKRPPKTVVQIKSTSEMSQNAQNISAPLTAASLAALPTSETQLSGKAISQVSIDDQSVSSGSTTGSSTLTMTNLSPWVPKDPSLVAAVLKEREVQEKLNVAKAMLYEAYLKALNAK